MATGSYLAPHVAASTSPTIAAKAGVSWRTTFRLFTPCDLFELAIVVDCVLTAALWRKVVLTAEVQRKRCEQIGSMVDVV